MSELIGFHLVRDQAGLESWLKQVGFTYDSLKLEEHKAHFINLDHPSPKFYCDSLIRFSDRRTVADWWDCVGAPDHKNMAPKRWFTKVLRQAKRAGHREHQVSGLIVAKARGRVKRVELPRSLYYLYYNSEQALKSLEKIYASPYVPTSTANTISELRLAHEHLINRLWETADLPTEVVLSDRSMASFATLEKLVETLVARADELRAEHRDLESDSCVSMLESAAEADAAFLAMIS